MGHAIQTQRLRKEYGQTVAVDGIDFTVPEGTVYGFLGPNGAGKTTTMQMLTGLTAPTSGTGTVGGASITDRDALRGHIGYLPEEPPLFEEVTAREQLSYVAGLGDTGGAAVEERIETLFDRLDLTDDVDTRISDYSKGMRQKTAFVQATFHDPDVVFLDEPTSGLDPRAARTLRTLITELAADGTTVFLSTHILPVVEELADRVGVLYDGGLVAEAPPDELARRADESGTATLEDAFLELTGDNLATAQTHG
jgi:ABC-2 type transport system ATP-binding protein